MYFRSEVPTTNNIPLDPWTLSLYLRLRLCILSERPYTKESVPVPTACRIILDSPPFLVHCTIYSASGLCRLVIRDLGT